MITMSATNTTANITVELTTTQWRKARFDSARGFDSVMKSLVIKDSTIPA